MRIENMKIPPVSPEERKERIEKKLKKQFGFVPEWKILRRSVDARRKDQIGFVYTLDVEAGAKSPETPAYEPWTDFSAGKGLPGAERAERPVVVGFGPAGIFAALLLARAGLRPIVLEQGAPVEERQRDVESFWAGGRLDPWSNVQFGEGGAGTFSDGKLNTGIKDPSGRIPFILQTFAEAGADPSVTYDAHPHVGTDVLRTVVRNLREEIRLLGGEIRFHTQLTGLVKERGKLTGARIRNVRTQVPDTIPAEQLILAIGHSARQTFEKLLELGVEMKQKAFAAGVRIQHPQKLIDRIQYGTEERGFLPPADYKLTARSSAGRGVYSFCMCPGGEVVNASSEEGRLCVNGMSSAARDGENANSALIVQVGPEDFGSGHPLAGMEWQRRLEEAAFRAGGGAVPVERLEDFVRGQTPEVPAKILPVIRGKWAAADLRKVLPEAVSQAILEAMPQFDRKMPGFADPDAVLAGTEARTSSPVVILRDEGFESSLRGLYPCGEGAGYAGGISSAAVDGLKTAEAVLRKLGGQ